MNLKRLILALVIAVSPPLVVHAQSLDLGDITGGGKGDGWGDGWDSNTFTDPFKTDEKQTFPGPVTGNTESSDNKIPTTVGQEPTSMDILKRMKDVRDKKTPVRRGQSELDPAINELESVRQSADDGDGNRIIPGTRKVLVTTYNSIDGLRANMYGEFHNKVNSDLKSPLAVKNITWMLTEPGVATGMQQALAQSALLAQQQMMAEQAYLNQLNQYAEIRDPAVQAYLACIAKRSEIEKEGEGIKGGWTSAIDYCTREVNFVSDTYAMGYQDDPRSGQDDGSNLVYLTSYLFNPEILSRAQTGNAERTVEYIDQLRRGFKDYIGDIAFTVDKLEVPNDELGKTSTNAHEFQVRKLPPKEMTPVEKIWKHVMPDVWKAMFHHLHAYCLYRAGASASSSTSTAATDETAAPQSSNTSPQLNFYGTGNKGKSREEIQKHSDEASYWRNEKLLPTSRIQMLSSPAVAFGEGIGSLLYVPVEEVGCEALNPEAGDKFAYDLTKITERGKLTGDEQIYYTYALSVAQGQVFQALVDIEVVINSLTMGSFNDSFVKPQALQLLYEAVPGGVGNALAKSTQAMESLISTLRLKAAQKKGGQIFVDAGQKSRANDDRMNGNGGS